MDQYPSPQRTSVLAILSLVFSLLCFIPFLGALGIIFGGAAILFISSSRGRLGGLGLAIAGVLIGLAMTVIWLFVLVGALSITKEFNGMIVAPTSKMMAALESGDYVTARQNFDTKLDTAVTDKQLAEFVAAYQADVGSFQSMPTSMMEFFASYGQVGPLMQNYNGGNNEFPMPATFSNGMAVVLAGMPQGSSAQQQPGGVMPRLINLGVLVGPGQEVWLLDPRTLKPVDNSASGAGEAGVSGGGDASDESTDEEDADEAAGSGG